MIDEIKKEISELKINTGTLRSFGLLIFVVFGIVAILLYRKNNPYWLFAIGPGFLFLFFGIIAPNMLRRSYVIWMTFAIFLGFIMTRVILTLTFYLLFTPIGLFLRISGKDLLDEKINKNTATHWKKYETIKEKSRYKKMF